MAIKPKKQQAEPTATAKLFTALEMHHDIGLTGIPPTNILQASLRPLIQQIVNADRALPVVACLLMYNAQFRNAFMTNEEYNQFYFMINNTLARWNAQSNTQNARTNIRVVQALGLRIQA